MEFSLLALPFALAVVCIIELGLYFSNAFLLEASVTDASRSIKTGSLQSAPLDDQEDAFRQALCNHVGIVANCAALQYEVRKLESFTTPIAPVFDEDGNLEEPVFDASAVTAGCVALVRAAYRYQFVTPFFGHLFGAQDNTRLLMATTIFRTEPYDLDEQEGCQI